MKKLIATALLLASTAAAAADQAVEDYRLEYLAAEWDITEIQRAETDAECTIIETEVEVGAVCGELNDNLTYQVIGGK